MELKRTRGERVYHLSIVSWTILFLAVFIAFVGINEGFQQGWDEEEARTTGIRMLIAAAVIALLATLIAVYAVIVCIRSLANEDHVTNLEERKKAKHGILVCLPILIPAAIILVFFLIKLITWIITGSGL